MFTLLWAATTILYTYYTMKFTDMGAMGGNQKMLQYMQYFMPVMFLFFFNNYASGLTLYLLFSNLVNIGLTLGTKQFIFNDEKIMAELALNKEKPKKRSAFSERLEQAMKEQQRVAQERSKQKSKK
jgi:YidC/Oxa1 family membrane protein insertase